jgi:hypothetical protein
MTANCGANCGGSSERPLNQWSERQDSNLRPLPPQRRNIGYYLAKSITSVRNRSLSVLICSGQSVTNLWRSIPPLLSIQGAGHG